jgi:hypothetical protein
MKALLFVLFFTACTTFATPIGPFDPRQFDDKELYILIADCVVTPDHVYLFYERIGKGEPSFGYIIGLRDDGNYRLGGYGYTYYGVDYIFKFKDGEYVKIKPVLGSGSLRPIYQGYELNGTEYTIQVFEWVYNSKEDIDGITPIVPDASGECLRCADTHRQERNTTGERCL